MEKRLRIEFEASEQGRREKLNFQSELTHHTIGWADDTAKKYQTLVDIFVEDLDTHEQLAVRNALEHRSDWSGVGPICGYDEKHGSTAASYERASRDPRNHIWKCLRKGCGWQECVLGSGFMPLMDFNNQIQRVLNAIEDKRRADPGSKIWNSISGRSQARADALWLEALRESQRYFNKNLDRFDNVSDAMSHMRQGGQVQIPAALMFADYVSMETKLLEFFRHSLQTGEELVVAMADKVHEPMKHVLPLEYFEERKREIRGLAKSQSFALGVYKPWETVQTLKRRLAEIGLDNLSKEERLRILYGGVEDMTDYEKSRPLKLNEPEMHQIPRKLLEDAERVLEDMKNRGVVVDEKAVAEAARKLGIDTETTGQNPMVAYNPAFDMKVLEGMALGLDRGVRDETVIGVAIGDPDAWRKKNEELAHKIGEIEALKKIIEEQNQDLDGFRKRQHDKHWLHDEHIKLLDDIFMFFAGLNLQDHAVAEQRKFLELMRKFKTLMLDLKEALKT